MPFLVTHVLKRQNIQHSATSTRFRDKSAVGQHTQPHAKPRGCAPRVSLCCSSSPAGTRGLLQSLRLNSARWCARYRSGRGARPGFCVALSAHSAAQVARVHRALRPTADSAGGDGSARCRRKRLERQDHMRSVFAGRAHSRRRSR